MTFISERSKAYFNKLAPARDRWKRRARYYHQLTTRLVQFLVPPQSRVLEIGSGTGDLLANLAPRRGVGVDIADQMTNIAAKKYPHLQFISTDAEHLDIPEQFDYVVISDVIGNFNDVQRIFSELHRVTGGPSRLVITSYNHLWGGLLKLLERWRLKMPQPEQSWLSCHDIENLLVLAQFEVIKRGEAILCPLYLPLISRLLNTYVARLPVIRRLCLTDYFVARPRPTLSDKEYSVSVIIPVRNEAGNIEAAVTRLPRLGTATQIIFVEGGSTDNTRAEIERVIEKYRDQKEIILVDQGGGTGKGDAVRRGFSRATGEVLMILDADLTVRPEELPKFYQALRQRQGEFIMGSRLVYPMENQAMRFLNILGNKFFSAAFSWLLDQPIKDTLCGTKVLFKSDYEQIAKNRSYFGDFDPFGDFDLIFGAAKLNLKILEIPIRYGARQYGTTNINRWRHGWLLLRMTLFAARKIKFV